MVAKALLLRVGLELVEEEVMFGGRHHRSWRRALCKARHLLADSCRIKTWDDNEDGIYFEDAFDLSGNSSVTDDKKLKKRPSTKTNKMIFVKKTRKSEETSRQVRLRYDEEF